jgi:hypothetical protein
MSKLLVGMITGLLLVYGIGSAIGCSTWDKLDKTERGAVIGTGSGAVLGGASNGPTGAVLGGAAGGVAGGLIGHEIDEDE